MDIQTRSERIFQNNENQIHRSTDTVFAYLMVFQWLAGIVAALIISPQTWIGTEGQVHLHVYAAIFLGGIITILPIVLALSMPGSKLTRYTIAVAQMLFSALLIHLTGGRIETHFHVFGSLAFLAFYRDWKVLVIATIVTALDHLFRGIYYPQSVFGVYTASEWRWIEHSAWVVFEDIFLFKLIRDSLSEMRANATREASLEITNKVIEAKVEEKTNQYKELISKIEIDEKRMNLALNAANIGSWSWDVKRDIITADDRLGPIYGLKADAFPQKYHQFAVLLHPEDRDYVAKNISGAMNKHEPYDVRYRIIHPDSSIRMITAKGHAHYDESGNPKLLVGICMDVTEEHRAENELKALNKDLARAEGRIKGILNSAVDAIITINEYGQILSVNKATVKMFGYEKVELLNKNIKKLMPSPYNEEHDQYLVNYMSTGIAKVIGSIREVIGKKKDGTIFPIEISISEVEGQDERIFSGVVRDISDRKENEAKILEQSLQLEKSNHELDQFAYIASHDLKEPLRGIYAYTNFLKTDYGESLDAEANEMLDTIKGLCENLTNLMNSLLEFSRLGRVDFAYKVTNIQQAVDAVIMSIKLYLNENNAEIIFEDTLPEVFCDSVRIGEVFRNLITNAVKYNKNPNKQVTIGCKSSSEHGRVFYVKDNGIGIDPKHFDDVFQIFRRLNSASQFAQGTGVGLTLVKKIIERHGGKIWLESEKDKGTTFFFSLNESLAKNNEADSIAVTNKG